MTQSPRSGGLRPIAALSVAVVAIATNWYLTEQIVHAPASFVVSLLLLGVLPAATGLALWHVQWADLGLTLGRRNVGRWILVAGVPLALVAGGVGAGSDPLTAHYPLYRELTRAAYVFVPYALSYTLYYVGFEFLFRGYLLLGLADTVGPTRANLLQALLAVLAHVGKPGIEVLAAFPASLVFGWAALKTKSIWYVTAVHWLVGVSLDWAILGRAV